MSDNAPEGVPREYLDANPHVTWTEATPTPAARFDAPQIAGSSMDADQLEAAWAGIKRRRDEMMARVRALPPAVPPDTEEVPRPTPRLIGIAGRAGAGKSLVASLIPGAAVVGLADPLYAGLSAMFGVPEAVLRSRAGKGSPLPAAMFHTPRTLLQLLGTEWGREMVDPTIWILQAKLRVRRVFDCGASVVAVPDVRFENEAAWIRAGDSDLGYAGTVWHVVRPDAVADGHISEAGIAVAPGDVVITNDGSISDLHRQVMQAITAQAYTNPVQ